jgi:hypothetical protein
LTPFDGAGVVGVVLILIAYAAAQLNRLDPTHRPALFMNLIGSCLILTSLTHAFNLSAALVEAAWALIAVFGLVRTLFRRR